MKKGAVFIIILISCMLMLLSFKYTSFRNFSSLVTIGVLVIIIASYFIFEKSSLGTKEISIIATLSTFAAITRVPFATIPNVQPTTFLIALSGYVFGPFEGFMVGSTSAFISNIFLGHGPWTPWQMAAWGIVGLISGFIGKYSPKISAEKFSIICFCYGFLFDWIMNLWHVLGFIKPITMQTILLAYITGLTVDIMHAAGNFIFSIIFFDKLKKVLMRFKKRLETTYINNEEN